MSHIASIGQQTEQSAEKDRKAEAWLAKPQHLVRGLIDEAGLRALGDRLELCRERRVRFQR